MRQRNSTPNYLIAGIDSTKYSSSIQISSNLNQLVFSALNGFQSFQQIDAFQATGQVIVNLYLLPIFLIMKMSMLNLTVLKEELTKVYFQEPKKRNFLEIERPRKQK